MFFRGRKRGSFSDCSTFISLMFRTHVIVCYSPRVTQVRDKAKPCCPGLDCRTVQSEEQVTESFMGEAMVNWSFSSVSFTFFILLDISQSELYYRLVAHGRRLDRWDFSVIWYTGTGRGKAKNMCEKLKWQGHVDSLIVGAAAGVCCITIRDGPTSMNEARAGLNLHPLLWPNQRGAQGKAKMHLALVALASQL